MAKYTKKPVEIEAWPIAELNHLAAHSWNELPKPVIDAYERGDIIFGVWNDETEKRGLNVRTMEGMMTGSHDDLLIQGVKGELYPCKPDIFDLTYDKVPVNDHPELDLDGNADPEG